MTPDSYSGTHGGLARRLVRRGFSLLYNQLAWSYDAVAWAASLGQWREWVHTAVPFLRGPRILDLAHGTGILLPALVSAGYTAIGYDLSVSMGRIARRKTSRRGINIPLVRGMAQHLPFCSGWFDSVVCTFPAEFILHPITLREIRRVLNPDGVLVLVLAALPTDRSVLARLMTWLFAVTGQGPPRDLEPPPQFEAAGFRSNLHWVSLPRSQVVLIVSRLAGPSVAPTV